MTATVRVARGRMLATMRWRAWIRQRRRNPDAGISAAVDEWNSRLRLSGGVTRRRARAAPRHDRGRRRQRRPGATLPRFRQALLFDDGDPPRPALDAACGDNTAHSDADRHLRWGRRRAAPQARCR